MEICFITRNWWSCTKAMWVTNYADWGLCAIAGGINTIIADAATSTKDIAGKHAAIELLPFLRFSI
jgi:hypothetical protein